MTTCRGKLIVLEGTDGSGKATQTRLLVKRLRREGFCVATFAFPQHGRPSAALVDEYLRGAYGETEKVSPYAASLFYALDRFDCAQKIREKIAKGFIVILDRYVDSNAAYQGGKIKNAARRLKFLKWLYETEYKIFGIPKPDTVLILRVPALIGQRLADKRGSSDMHEKNLKHLRAAEESYLWLARKFPRYHHLVECMDNGALLTPEKVYEKIWNIAKKIVRLKPHRA